jgi:asparagine synthase (glutamine-hydrolysing)
MSRIAGVVQFDGAPALETAGGRMRAILEQRGQAAQWSDERALLLHARRSEESATLVSGPAGLTITGDLRLDDHEELCRALGLTLHDTGDAELVLAAYAKWGAECVLHLEGDFAFAIWDGPQQTLFCARDPFGVKPFAYALMPHRFVFASQIGTLLRGLEAQPRVDETRLADYLSIYFDDHERTFYEGVRRLPGGHTLTLHDGRIAISRYWSPEDARDVRFRTDDEYAAAFFEQFDRAVRSRMGAPGSTGAMLSGGLDSSSISALAARLSDSPLPVFSWVFSDAMEADERAHQETVAAASGMQRHVLDTAATSWSPWSELDEMLADGPVYAPNFYMNLGAGRTARGLGLSVLLDGLGGDSSISHGRARMIELFLHGRGPSLLRELRAMARTDEQSLRRAFINHVAFPLLPTPLFDLVRKVRGRQGIAADASLLRPGLASQASTSRHRDPLIFSSRQEHVQQLKSPLLGEGLELMDRIHTQAGVEGRYPFFDRRLVEFCIGLPPDQKLDDGFTRVVARRAFRGLLPDSVLWRRDKGKPGLHVVHALRSDPERLKRALFRDGVLESHLDIGRLKMAADEFLEGWHMNFARVVQLWSAAVAAEWLRSLSAPYRPLFQRRTNGDLRHPRNVLSLEGEATIVRDFKSNTERARMETTNVIKTEETRKPYETPTLTDFGSCAELTQGTFAGVGADSGIYS